MCLYVPIYAVLQQNTHLHCFENLMSFNASNHRNSTYLFRCEISTCFKAHDIWILFSMKSENTVLKLDTLTSPSEKRG